MLINGHICGLSAAGLSALALAAALSIPMQSMAGPEGGVISAGSGSIAQPNAATTNVLQNTHRMAVDWQSFNLTAQETVNFNQPSASAAVLNRIHDQNPSQIFGAINANGRVFLANPNGIVFGQTATVNVGALIAAGMNISNNDFMAGNYNFTAGENGAGVVVNRGLINAATGGSVGLLGSTVINEGIIVADYGNIELASGNRAVVNFDGDGLLNIQVSEDVLNNAVENDAAISNKGTLLADGGQVVLTAHAASDVFDNAINNEGIIKAARIDNTGGVIRLVGNSGTVLHSGEISAQGENGSGGTVHVLGDRVGLIDDASIDVSGDSGGGTVLVGGDYQGQGDIQTASRTFVGSKASINADAVETGDGGQVVVWADEITQYAGAINARGGVAGGNGGEVEVSGRQQLRFQGEVDLSASNGDVGHLLLDPTDITISMVANDDITSGTPFQDDDVNNDGTSVLNRDTLQAALGNSDVTVTTSSSATGSTNGGRITVDATVTWDTNTLSLDADENIVVNADLNAGNTGSMDLSADNDININASITTSGLGSITLTANADLGEDTSGQPQGDVSGQVSIGSSGRVMTSGGDISISGNDFEISSVAASVDAGVGTIAFFANGRTDATNLPDQDIDIGEGTTPGDDPNTMDISAEEVAQLNARTYRFTSDTTIDSRDGAPVVFNGPATLILNAATQIRQQPGAGITVSSLEATAIDGIGLNGQANQISNVSLTNTNNDITFSTSGALDIATGGISNSGGNVTLDAGGTITQNSGGTITTNTLTTSSNGGTTLDNVNNTVGSYTATNTSATSGDISLTTDGALDIAAPGISNSVGDVTLTAGGAITQTDPLSMISANTLTTSSNGGTTLDNVNNTVGSYTATNTSATSGDISLTTDGALDIAAAGISNSVGNVTLDAGGTITQNSGGTITTNTLTTSSNGGTTLDNVNNTVGSYTATNTSATSGDISLTTDGALDIAAAGISNSVGNVTLNADGKITQTGIISTNTLTTSSDGGTTLMANNTIGSFAATNTTSGDVELMTTGALDIAAGGISNSVGDVTLEAGGAITQIGTISTNTLTTSSDGGTTLTGNNAVANFTATNINSDDVAFRTLSALEIVAPGISNSSGTIELIADSITLNAPLTSVAVVLRPLTGSLPISLGSGSGLLLTQSDITQVMANTLMLGSSNSYTGDINLNTDIDFGSAISRLELLTSGAGRVSGASLLELANGSTLVVSAGSGIDLGGDNNAATVSLNNSSTGNIVYNSTLTTAMNISAVNDSVGGTVSITADNDVTIDTASSTTGAGSFTVDTSGTSGNITINNTLNSDSVILNSGANITQNAGGVITASSLDTTSNGNTTLDSNNNVASFTTTNTNSTSGDIALTTLGALDIAAGGISNSGGNVTLIASGAITQTGTIITTGILDTTSVGGITLTGSNTVANFTADNINGGGVVLTNASGGTLNVTTVTNTGGGSVTISESGMLIIDGDVKNTDAPVELFADTMDITGTGTVDSGTGLVTMSTINTARGIEVGNGANNTSTLNITDTMLSKITTDGGVTIGSTGHTAGISVVGDVDKDKTATITGDGAFTLVSQGNVSVDAALRNEVNTELQSTLNDIRFGNGAVVESSMGSITIDSGANIRGLGALELDAANDLIINKSMVIDGNTLIKAGTLNLQQDITTTTGTLELASAGTITFLPDITLTSAGVLTLSATATASGNLTLAGEGIKLPMDLTVDGTASLNAGGGTLEIGVSGTGTGTLSAIGNSDIVITASDLDLNGGLDSVDGLTRISDNGNGIGLGRSQADRLNIGITELERISGSGMVLSTTADLEIEGNFNSSSTVPLTIDAGTVTLPQATSIIHGASLDLTNSAVNASSSLNLDITGAFAMNGTIDAASTVDVNATQGVTMGEPSSIVTSNDQVDITTAGGDVRLGLIDVGNASVNVTASAGSILNNNGVFTDITQSNDNVRSANVTLDAIDRIGVSSTDAITLNINSGGLITLDFGAPKAFINNKQNTKIVNLGSGEVAIGFIFSSEIIGIGHYVGVNNERNPPGSDTDAEAAKQSEMISVLGADYRAVPLGEEEGEEIISTLSPTVPVLIRTTQGWEFKAPSRSRRPGDTGEQPGQRKDIRYIDW